MCRTRWQPCCFNKLSSPLSHFLIITSCVRRAKHRCTLDTHTLHFQPPPPPVKVVEVLVGCQQFPFLQAKHQGLSNTQTRQEAQMPHWSMDQSLHCSRLQAIYSMCLSTHAHMYTQSTVLLCASEQGKKYNPKVPLPLLNSQKQEEVGGVERGKTFAVLVPETTSKW